MLTLLLESQKNKTLVEFYYVLPRSEFLKHWFNAGSKKFCDSGL